MRAIIGKEKKFILTILLVVYCTNSWSQNNGSIRGFVRLANNKPVMFANVALLGTDNKINSGAISDSLGYFQIHNIPQGIYTLQVHFIGFVPYEEDSIIISNASKVQFKDILLKRNKTKLDEIQVVAERPFIEQSLGQTTVNVGEHLAGAGENAIDLMRFVPSVSTDEDNNVLLRGAPVTILVDGVETDLANILEQLPAETIDKLEIITNPSAKYASRNGNGIINIVLKKDKIKGSNGRIEAAIGHPERWLVGSNFTLRLKKFSAYSNININHNTDEVNTKTHRTSNLNDKETKLTNIGISRRNMNNMLLRQGFKYQINKTQFIDLRGLFQTNNNQYNSHQTSHAYRADSTLKSHNVSDANGSYKRKYWELNVSWNKQFKNKSSIKVFTKYEHQRTNNPSNRFIQPYNVNDGSISRDYTTQLRAYPESITSTRLKMDYEYPINKHLKIEAGGIVIHRWADASNNFLKTKYSYIAEDDAFNITADSTKSNVFSVNEISPAVYGVVSTEVKKVFISLGLRYEFTHIEPYSLTGDTGLIQKYHNLLPTLQLSTPIGEKFTIGFSWSKRIKQPKYKQLNPFIIYNGLYSKSGGNPLLKPQEISNYELSAHWLLGKHSITPSLFYKENNGLINQYQHIVIEDEREVLYRQFLNIGNSQQLGFELNMSNRIVKNWSIKSNFLVINQAIEHHAKGHYFEVNNWAGSAKLTSDVILPHNFRLQLTGVYESPAHTVSGYKYEYYFLDMGIRKTIFKKKASLYLKYSDALNTIERKKLNNRTPNINTYSVSKQKSRRLLLSFTYKFNSLKKMQ